MLRVCGRHAFLGSRLALILALGNAHPLFAVQEQLTFQSRLERALAILDSTETERGMDSLRALLVSVDPGVPSQLVVRAYLHLAAASWALGLRDSAVAYLREVVRANPFAVPDPEIFNPEIVAAFRQTRRSTPALDLRIAADTVIQPAFDRYLVALAVGEPREVTIALLGADTANLPALEERTRVDSSVTVPLTLLTADSVPIEPGFYRLLVEAGPGLEVSLDLRVDRLPVDTVPQIPPPDSTVLRPETRKGPPATVSALAGTIFGAATAILPSLLGNRDLSRNTAELGAALVGGSIAVTGVVGMFVGRRPVPVPENVLYNRNLRASWEAQNQEIATENARRRRWAPLKIEVTRK